MSGNDWTRDAADNYVDWTRPPYRQGGLLVLLLEGEDPARLSPEIFTQRIREYSLLVHRELKGRDRGT